MRSVHCFQLPTMVMLIGRRWKTQSPLRTSSSALYKGPSPRSRLRVRPSLFCEITAFLNAFYSQRAALLLFWLDYLRFGSKRIRFTQLFKPCTVSFLGGQQISVENTAENLTCFTPFDWMFVWSICSICPTVSWSDEGKR